MTTGQAARSRDEIREEIVLRAPPARVWRALTDPAELLVWWGDPAAYRCTRWVFTPKPGSPWRVEGTNARGGAFWVEGEVLEADPPRRLSYSWKPSWIEVPATTVRIALEPAGEGTRLVWRHCGFEGYPQALEDHRGGLPSVIRWLARYVDAA